jgi:uncharacterized protein YndB with AHSA1/START domain
MTDAFVADWTPSEKAFMTAKITFEDVEEDKTRCTAQALHWSVSDREEHEQMGFYHGWGESFERYEAVVLQLKASVQ